MAILKLKESDIVRQVLAYLAMVPQVPIFWRVNTGALKVQDRFIRFGAVGVSDIVGMTTDGRLLAIECKTPQRKKNLSVPQRHFLTMVNHHGGIGFVATGLEDVEQKLRQLNIGRQNGHKNDPSV